MQYQGSFTSLEHNHTPRCSYKVGAAGLSWLEHFRVQCYTQVKVHCYLATKPEVESFRDQGFVLESFRVQSFVASCFTLKGGARHQFINREQPGNVALAHYAHYQRAQYYQVTALWGVVCNKTRSCIWSPRKLTQSPHSLHGSLHGHHISLHGQRVRQSFTWSPCKNYSSHITKYSVLASGQVVQGQGQGQGTQFFFLFFSRLKFAYVVTICKFEFCHKWRAIGASLSELHDALVFHRKCLGKRLGHQMYMVVFVEECSMGMCMGSSWAHCTQCWVSLIAGVEYGVEQWVENGMERWAQLTHVTGTAVQGCASYYVSRALT